MSAFDDVGEMMESLKNELQIKLADRMKLKKAINELGNKRNYIDPEEVNIVNSMQVKINKLKNMINNLKTKETNIAAEKSKIESQINTEFDKIMKSIKDRKAVLLKQLNDIINKKKDALKDKMVKYQNTFDGVAEIEQETSKLINTPIQMQEIQERKGKVMEIEKRVMRIIEENDKNNMVINEKVGFIIKTDDAMQVNLVFYFLSSLPSGTCDVICSSCMDWVLFQILLYRF